MVKNQPGANPKGFEQLSSNIVDVLFKDIAPPTYVERMNIDKEAIEELALNIKQNGLINPLQVKKSKDKYEIIAGHRRYLALRLLGVRTVKCSILKGNLLEHELIKLSENLLRVDLNDVEEAAMLARLNRRGGMNEKKLAKMIGKSEGYVRQKLQIMKYPEEMLQALERKEVTFSVCRELMRLKDKELIIEYLRHAKKGGATPAIVKAWVEDILDQEKRDKLKEPEVRTDEISPQVQPSVYVCVACGEDATLSDSALFRIHHSCYKELTKGG